MRSKRAFPRGHVQRPEKRLASSPRALLAIALLASSMWACRTPAVHPAPAALIDWSAEDSSRVAWLTTHGRTVRGRYAIVVAPADSLTDAAQRALTDSIDRGVTALRRLMGAPYSWMRIADRPITFYVSPERFVSHASGRGETFLSLWRVRGGQAPILHEASHELLAPPAPFDPDEYADTLAGNRLSERWPLWLTEGLPDYLAQTVAAEEHLHEGDVFTIGGLAAVDSVCAARASAHPRHAEWLATIGATGEPRTLFTSERATLAPAFYACSQSMTKFLVDRIGVTRTVALFPALKAGTWEQDIARAAGMPLAELRRRWLQQLRLAE